MTDEIINKSKDLLKRIEKASKFSSKYKVYPLQEAVRIFDELNKTIDLIPEIKAPKNQEELIQAELKRRLAGEAQSFDSYLSSKNFDFDTVITLHGIPESDIKSLEPWLKANRSKTLEAIERLYKTKDVQTYELGLPVDIPIVRNQIEAFATIEVENYHRILGELLQDLTKVGGFLRDIGAVPTTNPRSYFHTLTNKLAIGIPAICHTDEKGRLHLREKDLIELYGHEGMGHALNQIITKSSKLPYFLTKDTTLTLSTAESVAQFYQKQIFEDLKNSPETQKELDIKHKFNEIYQEQKDMSQLQGYSLKLFQYAITVLADKSIGDPKEGKTMERKIDLLKEVSLNPTYPLNFVEDNKDNFDSKGNLSPRLVSELIYCAQPVQRALKEFEKQDIKYEGEGRSKIDATLLTGFWTPIGYVDNARLRAKEK